MSILVITHPTKPGDGELTILKSEGQVGFESAVQTCSHCQAVVEIHRKDKPYGYCRKCDHVLCESCARLAVTQGCTPFKALIDRYIEEQYRAVQSYPLAG